MSANRSDDEVPQSTTSFRAVVVAPIYNHAQTLADVLDRIARLNLPMVIINDGSTDDTAAVAEAWVRAHPAAAATVLTHDVNCGKAAALRTGFAWAAQRSFTHAATIDTDGQLDPEQIPDLLAAARLSPHALVLGRRSAHTAGLPRANLVGWYTSALGLRVETQLTIPDSQCGLRVYPLALTERVYVRARRFGFEAEVIARAAWSGFGVREVPVECRYPKDHRRTSHFRPWLDGARGFFMHARLTLRRLNPWPIRAVVAAPAEPDRAGMLRRAPLRDQFNPWTAWRDLRRSRLDQLFLAAACGIGTFMAALPLGGWQWVAALYAGLRLRVHFLPLIGGVALAYLGTGNYVQGIGLAIGHHVLHFTPPPIPCWPLAWSDFCRSSFVLERVLGGVVVGFFLNWMTIGVLVLTFRRISIRVYRFEKP